MSLLWTLRKWVDPIEYANEEEARRRQREALPVDPEPGDDPRRLVSAPEKEELYRCRACGHTGRDGSFCPRCLAGTMRLLKGATR